MTPLDPKYIPLFNHPHIQEGWSPEVGDRVVAMGYQEIEVIQRISESETLGQRLSISLHHYIERDSAIFLPDTDWIAERWLKESGLSEIGWNFIHQIREFSKQIEPYNFKRNHWPLQVIALAFYIKDCHGLSWSEERREWEDERQY